MIKISASAKIILFGEHAVVHGQPAIAVPVSDVRAYVQVEKSRQGMTIASLNNRETVRITRTNPHELAQTVRIILDKLGIPSIPNLFITLNSQIPIGSGLGSGAAVSTAIARGICAAYKLNPSLELINEAVYEVEKLHHGTPSGIDNTVIVYERPVYFVRGEPIQTFSIARPFTLLIGDTGIHASTKIAVGDVRKLYESDPPRITPLFEQVGNLVRQARAAIESGNLDPLGDLMNQNHAILRELTVSSTELDSLCEAARQAGAQGAKLSGGGRGGNMIALVSDETLENVKSALLNAGAKRVLQTTLQPNQPA